MDPVTLSLLIGGAQAGVGLLQRGAAERRRKKAIEGFNYEIPSAVKEQLGMAREKASQNGLPGEDIYRSRIESDIAQTGQKAEAGAESSSDILGMYAKLFGQKSNIESDILQKGAEYKSANQLELMKTMGLMAEAQGQQFHYNKYLPFLSDMQMSTDQSGAGAANIAGGLNTAYSGWLNDWQMKTYKDLYGNQDNNGNQNGFPDYNLQYGLLPEQEKPLGMEPWMTDTNIWNK